MPSERPVPWEGAQLPAGVYRWGVALATVLGAALRVAHIARPFNRLMAWNEGHYAMIALNFTRYGLWSQHNELGVDRTFSPGVPWLIWASMKLFGPSEAAARLPIALFGIAAIPLLAAAARRLVKSEQIALAAAAFVAVAPGLVYFAQNVQLDTPSICCALAAAVMMLRYRDTRRRADAVWAGVWLAAAVWLKFTTMLLYPAFLALWWPARPQPPLRAAAAAVGFTTATALPSLAWIVSGWLTFSSSSGFTKRFFFRDWDLRGIVKALSEIPLAVEAHLFALIFLLLIVGVVASVRARAHLAAVWIWCLPWIALYIFAPWDSLVNRYYDLAATYLLTIVAAIGLWQWTARRTRRAPGDEPWPRALLAGLVVVVAVTAAYDVWDPMTDRIARASMAHVPPIDPSPFYSARIVGALPRGPTIADTPQTMFYAGGDPAWIEITGGDVRWKIDDERFDYIVLNDYGHGQEPYYAIDTALRDELARHHYVQIAPAAWAHVRTRIADLGGYRDETVPFWSPGAAWRRPGITVWE
ncbi:MAG TPA: glycosyltransferase family 39 protein [bacterium]|nr:glycosyltransferase family 39 protein [bacterium]